MAPLPDLSVRAGFQVPPASAPAAAPSTPPPSSTAHLVARIWEQPSTRGATGHDVMLVAASHGRATLVPSVMLAEVPGWRLVDVYAEPHTRVAFTQSPAQGDTVPAITVAVVDGDGRVRLGTAEETLDLLQRGPFEDAQLEKQRAMTQQLARRAMERKAAYRAGQLPTPRASSDAARGVAQTHRDEAGATLPAPDDASVLVNRPPADLMPEPGVETWTTRGVTGEREMLARLMALETDPSRVQHLQALANKSRAAFPMLPADRDRLASMAGAQRAGLARTSVWTWQDGARAQMVASTVRDDGAMAVVGVGAGLFPMDTAVQAHVASVYAARLRGQVEAPSLTHGVPAPLSPATETASLVRPPQRPLRVPASLPGAQRPAVSPAPVGVAARVAGFGAPASLPLMPVVLQHDRVSDDADLEFLMDDPSMTDGPPLDFWNAPTPTEIPEWEEHESDMSGYSDMTVPTPVSPPSPPAPQHGGRKRPGARGGRG